MRMPFGQFLHEQLEDIPTWYLSWIVQQPWVGDWLVKAIGRVLENRFEREECND